MHYGKNIVLDLCTLLVDTVDEFSEQSSITSDVGTKILVEMICNSIQDCTRSAGCASATKVLQESR
jgi:hypothetical protein